MNDFVEVPASSMSIIKRKPVYGFGVNDATYTVSIKTKGKQRFCPYYNVWKGMIQRCYDNKYQERQPTYAGCSVTKEWLDFSNFKRWMLKQDWKGKALDKDILVAGNKVYSPKTCVFVHSKINNLLMNCKSSRGDMPQGVTIISKTGKYRAKCRVDSKTKSLGVFFSIREAEIAYLEFKSGLIERVANNQTPIVRSGLLRHALVMKERIKLIS